MITYESAEAFGLSTPIVLIAVPSMQYHSAEFVFFKLKILIFFIFSKTMV